MMVRTWMRENLKSFSETFRDVKVETKYVANKHPILIAEYSISPMNMLFIENGLSRQVCVKNMPIKDINMHVTAFSLFLL